MNPNVQMLSVNLILLNAINEKNKQAILNAYEAVKEIELEFVETELLKEYNALDKQANTILYS